MKHCPFDGCRRRILPTALACHQHYSLLTVDQQNQQEELYNAWVKGKIDLDGLHAGQAAILRRLTVTTGGQA